MSIDIKPHAYDPATQPELFDGVLARRVVAFVIDFLVIAVPVVLAAMFIFAFGIVTLGLGFALYWLLPSATVVWAIVYFGATLGGPASATVGMRVMDLEMRTWYGAPAYFVLAAQRRRRRDRPCRLLQRALPAIARHHSRDCDYQ